MKKYMALTLGMLLLTTQVLGGIAAKNKTVLNSQMGPAARKVQLGTLLDQTKGALSVLWDASVSGLGSSTGTGDGQSDGVSVETFGQHYLGVDIPAKSLITRAWVENTDPPVHFGTGAAPGVSFVCSTGASGGGINLSSSTDYGSLSGGQLLDLTAQNTLATFQRNDSTTDCKVRAQVHGKSASSGKITLFLEYMQIR